MQNLTSTGYQSNIYLQWEHAWPDLNATMYSMNVQELSYALYNSVFQNPIVTNITYDQNTVLTYGSTLINVREYSGAFTFNIGCS